MARKTAAQKIETLVARTMKQKRGHKLYEYIRKDYGAITDLSDQLWEGYRVGDVSTRTMFHVRGWARDPASYDLEDLIKLANATVEEFPDGVVSEPTCTYSIWTDVPGACSATSSYIEKKLEVDPGFIDEINTRIDDFVEPARSAVNHTLAKLNLGDEEASDAALRHEVITTLTDQWSVKLYPPHNSKWTAEQWTAALYEAALGDEVTVINEFALALGIIESCKLEDVPVALSKFVRFTHKSQELFDLVIARGAPLLPLLEAAIEPLTATEDDSDPVWGVTNFREPATGLYLCTSLLAICKQEGIALPEATVHTMARFARLYTCNWFASGYRRPHLAWMHELFRLIPHDVLEEAVYGDGAEFHWDTVAVLPSETSAARAVASVTASSEDWAGSDSYEGKKAADAFSMLGEFAGPALAAFVDQGDVAARGRVAMMLAANGHDASIEPLSRALHDSSKLVRSIALQGLSKMSADAVADAMADVLATGKKDARVSAAIVLSNLSPNARAHAVAKAHLAGKERTSDVRTMLSGVKKK